MRFYTAATLHAAYCLTGVLAQSGSTTIGGFSGSHTALPRWCGKPYQAGSPNYDPEGEISPPQATQSPGLHLQIQTRHSIYDSSEQVADLIISANNIQKTGGYQQSGASNQWKLDIQVQGSKTKLASSTINADSTKNLIEIKLASLRPRLQPYNVVVHATPADKSGKRTYSASTQLYYLPAKNSGSTVKVDNLYGGMLVANNVTDYAFEPLLPFGFYTSCSGYLNYSLANVSAYKDLGFNAINPVCAFTDGDLSYLYDWMDQTNLWYQYDMRNSFLNLSSIEEQIPLLKDRSNLLSWYTADEPDGWQYALNSTRLAYDLLKEKDPYHPTALVLNCQNYFYKEYTSGTDYVMEDAYPVGIDPTYSRKFNTPCNVTYGDCGCDNCEGSLRDVSDRLDDFTKYNDWLGEGSKPLWAVLQAFSGEQYWARDPTPKETWVMMILGFNHKAKAMMSWTFPASDTLNKAHGAMSKVAAQSPVSQFLVGGDPTSIKVSGHPLLDVAYWTQGEQIMIALATINAAAIHDTFAVRLPRQKCSIASHPWGSTAWTVDGNGQLVSKGLIALATDILIFNC